VRIDNKTQHDSGLNRDQIRDFHSLRFYHIKKFIRMEVGQKFDRQAAWLRHVICVEKKGNMFNTAGKMNILGNVLMWTGLMGEPTNG